MQIAAIPVRHVPPSFAYCLSLIVVFVTREGSRKLWSVLQVLLEWHPKASYGNLADEKDSERYDLFRIDDASTW